MIFLIISVNAQPSKRNELLSALRLFTAQTSHEKGCEACHISQNIDDENLISLEETWTHRTNLDAHFRSDIFSALLGAVKLLGNVYEIRINDGNHTEGMEAVQSARLKGETS